MRRTRSAYIIRRRAGLWQEPEGGIYLKKDKAAAKQAAREQKEAERLRRERLQQKQDEKYMRQAITQAKKAEKIGEVPIGCVIVYDGKVIGRGYNRRKIDKNTLSHAELTAIRKASKVMGDWRLEECTLYVTLEPCQMCAGAIVQARIPRVVMGCMNPKAGCGGSILNLLEMKEFNHQVDVTRGVLESECSRILTDFFASLRKRLKTEKET
ncbi:MAG: nucleoside deaminase [Lachnospiraceae bacterium]|nr:nucleoside deaminase [Lachnospiraceae bacterium]